MQTQALDAAAILKSLEPLFREARAKGLWFYCTYQQLWFSPDELAKEHAKGTFIWGPVNWMLRNPKELLTQLEGEIRAAQERYEYAKARVGS